MEKLKPLRVLPKRHFKNWQKFMEVYTNMVRINFTIKNGSGEKTYPTTQPNVHSPHDKLRLMKGQCHTKVIIGEVMSPKST